MMNEFDQIIREHFDASDTKTRKLIVSLEDAEQTQLLSALSSALYDKIVHNVDKIDFGSIPRSRGDITKVDGYDNTMECLNIMRRLVMEYKQNPQIVDTVITAQENIRNRKGIFMKAFATNADFPMVLYNLIVLSIEQSVSFLISVCIQYIKDPATQDMSAALDTIAYNNTKDNLIFEQLADFNKSCLGSDLDDLLDKIIKNGGKITEADDSVAWCSAPGIPQGMQVPCGCPTDKVLPEDPVEKPMDRMPEADEPMAIHGSFEQDLASGAVNEKEEKEEPVQEFGITAVATGIGTGIAVGYLGMKGVKMLIKVVIPTMRKLTYHLINTRVKLSDCISVQADFIQANAYKLQYSTTSGLSDEKKKKVVEKQLKIAERMKKFANMIAIDNKKAEKSANEMSKEDEKQKKIDDIKDKLPPEIAADGDLF